MTSSAGPGAPRSEPADSGAPGVRAARAEEPAAEEAVAAARAIAIVAGHGDFAAGMVSAVAQITGRGDRLLPVTNRDLAPLDIEQALRTAAASHPVQVLFTDLPGGSCTMAARRLLRERPDLVLVTGTNLVTLLDFVLGADGAPTPDAVRRDASHLMAAQAAEKGRAALVAVAPKGPVAAQAVGEAGRGAVSTPVSASVAAAVGTASGAEARGAD